jgi:hypothetical protein
MGIVLSTALTLLRGCLLDKNEFEEHATHIAATIKIR